MRPQDTRRFPAQWSQGQIFHACDSANWAIIEQPTVSLRVFPEFPVLTSRNYRADLLAFLSCGCPYVSISWDDPPANTQRTAQAAQPQLIDRTLLVEQVENATDLVAVVGGQVQPCKRGATNRCLQLVSYSVVSINRFRMSFHSLRIYVCLSNFIIARSRISVSFSRTE